MLRTQFVLVVTKAIQAVPVPFTAFLKRCLLEEGGPGPAQILEGIDRPAE